MHLQKILTRVRDSSRLISDKHKEKKRIASLRTALLAKIQQHGSISFHDFMESALYDPIAGFYMKRIVFSEDAHTRGDFITSPKKLSPYYGQAIASLISQLDAANKSKGGIQRIVSIAAGDGTLDRDLLDWLEMNNPKLYKKIQYESVEISQRQIVLQKTILGHHAKKVLFVEESGTEYLRARKQQLEHTFLFSNEWLDTMPVHVIVKQKGVWKEIYVTKNWKGGFRRTVADVQDAKSVAAFLAYAAMAGRTYDTKQYENYHINLNAAMIETAELLSQALVSGFSLMIDYGVVGAEPPQSILTFTRNKKLKNVLAYPGSVDITTYIDWDIWTQASKPLQLTSVTCDLVLITTLIELDPASIEEELTNQIKNPAIVQSAGNYILSKKLTEQFREAEEVSNRWFHEGIYGAWLRSPYPTNSLKTLLWFLKKKILAGEKTR